MLSLKFVDNPTQTVRIGVTGHRFLSEEEKILKAIEEVYQSLTYQFPNRHWQIISPLAEGADRLVAGVFIDHGADLEVCLPLDHEIYKQGFSSDQSRREFEKMLSQADKVNELPFPENHTEVYTQLGRYILDHCDLLIAVWDGQNAQGLGGTGDVVGEALRRQIPLIRIHAGNRKPGTFDVTSLDEEQGKIDYERFYI